MAWDTPYQLLLREIDARREERAVIPESLVARIHALDPDDPYNARAVDPLYDELMAIPADPALQADEPDNLDAIRSLRPDGPRDLDFHPTDDAAIDRFHGAWTGRCVGCALGKPVEGIGMTVDRDGRVVGRTKIREYLANRAEWPLRDFFSGRDVGDGARLWCPASQRERIAYMEPDDDIHYSLVGLGVLEECGPTFDWQDVGRYWLSHIPIFAICTAEAQAIENLQMRSTRPGYWSCAATPAFTRRNRNPYRQWIGAQIRADGWAWVCAGKPELAAEFAYRDACWTHERNGIYGAMMFAAIEAASFVETDPPRLIEIGLSEIPGACRLAKAVSKCMDWVARSGDPGSCMALLEDELVGMSPVHTINNALICVIAMMYAKMDPFDAVTTAVMCGHDTDCNGATVGSIVGAAAGLTRFETRLAPRLHDTLKPSMIGFEEVRMRTLAERTLAQWKRVDAYHRARHA